MRLNRKPSDPLATLQIKVLISFTAPKIWQFLCIVGDHRTRAISPGKRYRVQLTPFILISLNGPLKEIHDWLFVSSSWMKEGILASTKRLVQSIKLLFSQALHSDHIDRNVNLQLSFGSGAPEFLHLFSNLKEMRQQNWGKEYVYVNIRLKEISKSETVSQCRTLCYIIQWSLLRFWDCLQLLLNTWWFLIPGNILCMLKPGNNCKGRVSLFPILHQYSDTGQSSIQPVFDSISNSFHREIIDEHCWGI